ncbi:MAG: phenylalanine--tRNA ligase subunit beta [Lachnospiraceae bacterium]|nr:phenylalanine--tRNA ligase subunit beta [Lachnospiraceae bacterium]
MFLSMNWISDYVDLEGLDKKELIARFSLSCAEVENEIFYKGSDISGIVVAKIISVLPHPESKKLHLLKVDIGSGEPVDVVCGAPNVREGMKTAFAKLGAHIGDIEITPRQLAGYTSNGMCCSEKEIGISDDHSGIMEITDDVALGTDLKDIYDIDDIIFEVDNKSLTNRPDLWGHYGIAREFAAMAERPLKPLDVCDLSQYDSLPGIDMKIESDKCFRYSCLKIENITKNVSPVNMRIRLFYCGMRAINLLADITNYIMLDMGQPMHAFDSRKVEKIRIKTFDKPFEFTTLDGVERKIDENTLMICNDNEPVAIAGIMGGLDSEIVEDTTTLTLESANFDAVSVRKSSVRLAHRTDASQRYEKCLDPEMCVTAIAHFVKILTDIDNGVKVVSRVTDDYKHHFDKVCLEFKKAYVDRYTGIEISNDKIVKTLTGLGFGVTLTGDDFKVDVPSFRATKDVTIKADIIEEITRIFGYDNFAQHTTATPLYPIRSDVVKSVEDRIKDICVHEFKLNEVHSYIWASYDELKELGIKVEDNVKLINSTNPNIETLRRSMIPTQLCQVKSNFQYAEDFGIFEIGHVVQGLDADNNCVEKKLLGITLFSKTKDLETLYYELKDIVDGICDSTKHKTPEYKTSKTDKDYIHPKNFNTILVDGKAVGTMGVAHPFVVSKIDKKANVVFAEIDVNEFSSVEKAAINYVEPGKFPAINIDLSFVTNRFAPIGEALKEVDSPLVKKVSVVDVYGEGDDKSVTVRISFAHDERTLTREEVNEVIAKLTEILAKKNIIIKE